MAYINGTNGNDYLSSGNGNDSLYGKDGNDILVGNGGNDLMYGGKGDDVMAGGSGSDTFRFKVASFSNPVEKDIITDFDPNSGDALWLQSWNASNLSFTLEQVGADSVITITSDVGLYTATNEITLVGVQATDLTSDDYFF